MRFKGDWASLIVGSKFTVFSLFYFVFKGDFPSTNPWGAYIWRGNLTEGFVRYRFGGLIFGGAYTRRGLFSELYDNCKDGASNGVKFNIFCLFYFQKRLIQQQVRSGQKAPASRYYTNADSCQTTFVLASQMDILCIGA